MRTVTYSPEAVDDLSGIVAYVEEHSPPAADRLADEVDRRVELLASQPGIGRERPELRLGMRSTVVERTYLLFYRFDAMSLEIVRILHGARDLDAIFTEA